MLLELDIETIQQLLDSPSQLLAQAKKAYEIVEQCFSWRALCDDNQVNWTDNMNDICLRGILLKMERDCDTKSKNKTNSTLHLNLQDFYYHITGTSY